MPLSQAAIKSFALYHQRKGANPGELKHKPVNQYKGSKTQWIETSGGPSRGKRVKYQREGDFDVTWRTPERRKKWQDHFKSGGRFKTTKVSKSSRSTPNLALNKKTSMAKRYFKKIGKRKGKSRYYTKSGKRANRSGRSSSQRITQIAKSVSLSLCEPKQFRAIDQYQVIGHNIPHFYTGGLNLGFLTNEAIQWNGGTSNYQSGYGVPKPAWEALTNDHHSLNTGIANQLKYLGRISPRSTRVASTTPEFKTAASGDYLDTREGREIVASKLTFKLTFSTNQAYSLNGTNAKYHCVLFRYKCEAILPRDTPNQAEMELIKNPVALANVDPLDHVGWNPYLKANHVFKGLFGEGSNWDTASGVGGNPTPGEQDQIQLAFNGSWSNQNFTAVQHKTFVFRQEHIAGNQAESAAAPLHQKTVYLTHNFKSRKLKYGLRRTEVADPPTPPVLSDSIAPDGYNYGVCVYASAMRGFVDCNAVTNVAANIAVPTNFMWTDLRPTQQNPCVDGQTGALATYDIEKSFYYKDP